MTEPENKKTDPATFRRAIPLQWIMNVQDAIRFYTEKLGFSLQFDMEWETRGEPAGFAVVERDGVELQLWICECEDRQHDGKGWAYIRVTGIDALYEQYVKAGVHVRYGIKTEEWGERLFVIEDPDGNRITFREFVGNDEE